MPRTLPDLPLPDLHPPSCPETWTLELKTLTPLFGGSSIPREVNKDDPVRSASIRGHLRFWWRAAIGRYSPSLEKMFEQESQIWGGTDLQGNPVCSLVGVRVEVVACSDPMPCAQYPQGKTFPDFGLYPGYALFPFQGKANRQGVIEPPAKCLKEVHFKVHLTFPEGFRSDLEHAVYSWVLYGGIGARTRRGCGSLQWLGAPAQIAPFSGTKSLEKVTGLPVICLYGPAESDAIRAWKNVVELYKGFRQQRNEGQERNRPGRSKWPEPDSIRILANTHAYRHPPRFQEVMFPRADLGLPIVFHFKDDREGDPKDHTLESTSSHGSRFASPVITKVIPSPDGKGYLPMLALLDAPHVWEEGDLKLGQHSISSQQVELSSSQRQHIAPLNGQPVRDALTQWYEKAGYRRTL